MLTRLLHTCGLYLGPENDLMPPQADNPEGFWEHLGLVALNDELLNELGGAWDLPPKADEDFTHARLDPLRLKARLLIEKIGRPVAGVICGHVPGFNAWLVASALGLKYVDAASNGRGHPTVKMGGMGLASQP